MGFFAFPRELQRAFILFPLSKEQQQKSDYVLKLLPDEGDNPIHLKEAFRAF